MEAQSAEAITLRINDVLAAQIRVKPEDWFWVHNRWKTPRPRFLLACYKRGIFLRPAVNSDSGMVNGIPDSAFPHHPPVTSHHSPPPSASSSAPRTGSATPS